MVLRTSDDLGALQRMRSLCVLEVKIVLDIKGARNNLPPSWSPPGVEQRACQRTGSQKFPGPRYTDFSSYSLTPLRNLNVLEQ